MLSRSKQNQQLLALLPLMSSGWRKTVDSLDCATEAKRSTEKLVIYSTGEIRDYTEILHEFREICWLRYFAISVSVKI